MNAEDPNRGSRVKTRSAQNLDAHADRDRDALQVARLGALYKTHRLESVTLQATPFAGLLVAAIVLSGALGLSRGVIGWTFLVLAALGATLLAHNKALGEQSLRTQKRILESERELGLEPSLELPDATRLSLTHIVMTVLCGFSAVIGIGHLVTGI